MRQRRHRPGFALEARQRQRIAGQVLRQDLDGDVAAEPAVAGAVHLRPCLRPPAGPESRKDRGSFLWLMASATPGEESSISDRTCGTIGGAGGAQMRVLMAVLSLAAGVAAGSEKVTFNKDVLPILQQRCQACHRPGEVGPMPLLTYQDARPWARAIREAVLIRKMPPWFAESGHAKLVNDPSLSRRQIDTLVAWADGSAPEGDRKDAPKPVEWVDGWIIGQPDQIFEMPKEFPVPAEGQLEYQHIVVPTGFREDKWVQAAEVRPGNRPVVHHVIAYVREPGSKWMREAKPGEPFVPRDWSRGGESVLPAGIVAGFAPGYPPTVLPAGQAILVKAGSDLVIQMHYTVRGKAATDRTKVGLIFAKEPVKQRAVSLAAHNWKFTIPPGAANHRVDSQITFTEPATLLAMMPHMHFRGKSFEFRAVYPTGESQILLRVPRYDFNWQLVYGLETPLRLPKGTRIECTAHFDNSTNNPHNPDPTKPVGWGDQTWEEMMIGWMTVAVDAQANPGRLVKEKRAAPAAVSDF